jgi:dCMP deaminase
MSDKIKKVSRPSKHQYFMDIAIQVSKRSHDAQTQVGCVLVSNKSDQILGTGYNGFVAGVDDNIIPNLRPEKYDYIIHSEMNLLTSLARNGGSGTDNTTLYCTLSPCSRCMRHLYQAGITRIIVKDKYHDYESLKNLIDLKIEESITVEGFYEIKYITLKSQIVKK